MKVRSQSELVSIVEDMMVVDTIRRLIGRPSAPMSEGMSRGGCGPGHVNCLIDDSYSCHPEAGMISLLPLRARHGSIRDVFR